MSNTEPTEPLPPRQEPPYGQTPPNGAPPYGGQPYGGTPYGAPHHGPPPYGGEPFYKRHGLAFAISTLVLSIVVLLGLVTAGAFAVANVVSRVGERVVSHSLPHQPQQGAPGMPGNGDDGPGGGKPGKQGGGQQGDQSGRVLLRGTIASISGSTWTVQRENGGTTEVAVTSSTVFGMPNQSASKSDFATGDEVVVIGTRSDGTVTATRILKLDSFPTRPPSTPGTPSTPGS
jgi:hypothetical protein